MGKIQPSEIVWENSKLKSNFYELEKIDSTLFRQISIINTPEKVLGGRNKNICINAAKGGMYRLDKNFKLYFK